MDDTVLTLSWRQVDRSGNGYIPSLELPLLVDTVNKYLKTPLINEEEMKTLKRFSQRDTHKRIYKSEFKTLFNSLVGLTFANALQLAQLDSKAIEQDNDVGVENKRVDDDHSIRPSFKKEWRKYKRLSETQEDEIKYRDDVIRQLETKYSNNDKLIHETSTLVKQNEKYEEEISFRDKIILERDETIKQRDFKIQKLQEQVKSLNDEISLLKGKHPDELMRFQWGKEDKFHRELKSRIQKQQDTIDKLKQMLYSKKKFTTPKDIKEQTNKKGKNYTKFVLIPFISLVICLFLQIQYRRWVEQYWFEMVDNADIDYAYYESRL